jgi:NAD-dependent SIR2 family protein deacetylase
MMIDLSAYKRIVGLTGAGVSAASGLRTYRGPDGLWKDEEVRRAAMAETLWTKPALSWRLFGARRMPVSTAQPNAAHQALVRIEESMRADQQFRKCFEDVLGERAATRLLRRVQFHYTPKHASWLNMAEIEIGILRRQCLDRRIACRQVLESEVNGTTLSPERRALR